MNLCAWHLILLINASLISKKITLGEKVFTGESKASRMVSLSKKVVCLKESDINLKEVFFVNPNKKVQSVPQCSRYCLNSQPNVTHVLVSHYSSWLFRDKFVCICALPTALVGATSLEWSQCRHKCPNSAYMCGNYDKDLVSVYCLKHECEEPGRDICETRKPHSDHGCVAKKKLDWTKVANVKNFDGARKNDCSWRCKDRHKGSVYSLTHKLTDDSVTCSCAYSEAFEEGSVVVNRFCQNLLDSKDGSYYTANKWNSATLTSGGSCRGQGHLGCMYSSLLRNTEAINLPEVPEPNPYYCIVACRSVYADSVFAAVRRSEKGLACECGSKGVVVSSLLGPSVACQSCTNISALYCGHVNESDPSLNSHSVYCLDKKPDSNSYNLTEITTPPVGIEVIDVSVLNQIVDYVTIQNLDLVALICLLAFICFILASSLTWLCMQRGISSLSKEVM